MVGNRTIFAFVVFAAVGCGSSVGSPAAGGSGGATPGNLAGQGGAGGHAGGNANGGAASGGAASGDAGMGGVSGHGGGGGGGAGGNASGGSGGAAGSGSLPACVGNDDSSAPFVDFVRTADPAPTPMGGAMASGTYFLTGMTYHGGTQIMGECFLSQTHEVLRVTATSATDGEMLSTEQSHFADGSGQLGSAQSFSYKAQGTSLLIDYTCGEPDEYSQPYTATSNQLLFIRGPFDSSCDKAVTLVLTYDKQP